MNPLFLLLGLFGVRMLGPFTSGDSTSSALIFPKDGDVVDKDDKSVDSTDKDSPSTPTTDNQDTPSQPSSGGNETPSTDAGGSEDTTDVPPNNDGADETPTTEPSPTPVGPDAPTNESQDGNETDGGTTASGTVAQDNISVMTGRVTTLEPAGDNIAGVEILSGVEHGNVTVNPDNTLALVLTRTDFVGNQSFSYQVTHTDGSTTTHQVNLNVTPGAQGDGWATGEYHYMLETDENDSIIVEAGENHTKVFVSGSNQALSLSDIASIEGVSVSQVTGQFMAQNGYGQTEGLALDEEAGMRLWNHVTPANSETSNWFLLERGYQYDNISNVLTGTTSGEDENHPLLVGSWGSGELPQVNQQFILHTNGDDPTSNVVVQDIYFNDGVNIARVDNIILDGIVTANGESVIGEVDGATIRNSAFLDAFDGDGRTQGLYMGWESYGVLLDGNFFDGNGWDIDGNGQDPTMFSHNIYLQYDLEDVTMRDSIIMRGASAGVQVRPGGYVENNVFVENQAQLMMWGGDYEDAGNVGYYSLVADNLVTSAGHKEDLGAYSTGLWDNGALSAYVDNIVAHLANPDGSEAWKTNNNGAMSLAEETAYNDTIVYNWTAQNEWGTTHDGSDWNVDGLSTNLLDQTTIQNFTAALLNQDSATINDLSNYLRAQYRDQIDGDIDANDIISYFQSAYGIAPEEQNAATDLNFVPNEVGDGIRWDNRLNWDEGYRPGEGSDGEGNAGDNVDLRGNHVVYGSNTEINELDLGGEGWLNVYGGRLDVNGGIEGDNAELNIEGAGQIWINGSGDTGSDIDVTASGGRFANTGDMGGLDLYVSGDTDAILATDNGWYEVSAGHTLSVTGSANAGFDDNDGDMAILDFDAGATLALSVEDGQLGEIAEFRSGAFGEDAPNVQSGIDLGDAVLNIDLAGLSSDAGNTLSLMSADELVGLFDDAAVDGLGSRNATILVDYINDTVTLQLSSGNGQVSIETVGEESDVSAGADALWQALTADQGVVSETLSASPDAEDDETILDAA